MPMQWDKTRHEAAIREAAEKHAKDRENVAHQVALKTQEKLLAHPQLACDSTMRNWVIKTLCGTRVHVLDRFVTFFPDLTADFVKLDEMLGDLIHKARKSNHNYTKK